MIRSRQSMDNGQDLVEYALILPIMMMMIIFMVDLGRVWFFYSTLTNVSREGARYGVVNLCEDEQLKTAARDKALGINPNGINFDITWNPDDCEEVPIPRLEFGATTLTVVADSDFEPITGYLGLGILPNNIAITTTMYVESFLP